MAAISTHHRAQAGRCMVRVVAGTPGREGLGLGCRRWAIVPGTVASESCPGGTFSAVYNALFDYGPQAAMDALWEKCPGAWWAWWFHYVEARFWECSNIDDPETCEAIVAQAFLDWLLAQVGG